MQGQLCGHKNVNLIQSLLTPPQPDQIDVLTPTDTVIHVIIQLEIVTHLIVVLWEWVVVSTVINKSFSGFQYQHSHVHIVDLLKYIAMQINTSTDSHSGKPFTNKISILLFEPPAISIEKVTTMYIYLTNPNTPTSSNCLNWHK